MKTYRIYVGEIPKDLKERISALHASAILSRGELRSVQGSENKTSKAVYNAAGRVRRFAQ